jgi:hypothetical protein
MFVQRSDVFHLHAWNMAYAVPETPCTIENEICSEKIQFWLSAKGSLLKNQIYVVNH